MDIINRSSHDANAPERSGGFDRRAVLMTAAAVAGAAAGVSASVSASVADTVSAASFGAPLVELHVPAGVLSPEQKTAMIKDMTEVVLTAMKLPADPAKKLFVQIFETADCGFGVNGQVFVPSGK